MQIKPMGMIIATGGILWLGSMVWLTGYRQGYDEGATTAWDDARAVLRPQQQTQSVELQLGGLVTQSEAFGQQ